jgi:hypothetical protein
MDSEIHDAVRMFGDKMPYAVLLAMITQDSCGERGFTRPVFGLELVWNVELSVPFRTLAEHERVSVMSPVDFPGSDTEWTGQRAVWGPLPILGAVAREQGYVGGFPGLCGVTGVDWSCRVMNKMRREYRMTVRETLLVWYGYDPRMAEKVFLYLEGSGNGALLN